MAMVYVRTKKLSENDFSILILSQIDGRNHLDIDDDLGLFYENYF